MGYVARNHKMIVKIYLNSLRQTICQIMHVKCIRKISHIQSLIVNRMATAVALLRYTVEPCELHPFLTMEKKTQKTAMVGNIPREVMRSNIINHMLPFSVQGIQSNQQNTNLMWTEIQHKKSVQSDCNSQIWSLNLLHQLLQKSNVEHFSFETATLQCLCKPL